MTDYCTLADLPADIDARAADQFIAGASRAIDRYCSRRFSADEATSARVYVARNESVLDIDDIADTTTVTVKSDDDGDGTYETTWAATSFQLEPLNGVMDGIGGYARWRVRALDRCFPCDRVRARVEVTAKWGWPAVPDAVKAVCASIVARNLATPAGVRGEVIGGYQVTYLQSSTGEALTPFALTEAEQAQLAPFVRYGIA